ncbi:WhiB family transcriptional regulator [Mycolicibacterium obuense]|nr:WhiB family transcriptional regulator [Mycolicibacterium obuense]
MTSPPSRRNTSVTEPPPCRLDPDQWFCRSHRTRALATCLTCPLRRSCAQLALECRPSWGMWAGIWIDGRFSAAAALLDEVAADDPPVAPEHDPPLPPKKPRRSAVFPAGVQSGADFRMRPRTLVFARSEGYCEIMATGCHLTADAVISRVPRRGDGDASTLFAVCQECAITLQRMDSQMIYHLGYRLDSVSDAAATPMLWRQKHRLLLDARGGLRDPSVLASSERPEAHEINDAAFWIAST